MSALVRGRRRSPTSKAGPPLPWWGDRGPAPHLQWAGVTIDLPAVWQATHARWESPDGTFYFDQDAADKATEFFPACLVHHIGEFAGLRFDLRDDQVKLLTRPIFGWKRASDGMRRFRKVFAFCPKGYGKSPWAAGTGLYLTRCDGEAAAECYTVAADRENARTIHDNAKVMVENSPHLQDGCAITKNAIVWADLHATYKVLSSDASTAHGFRPHAVLFDEFHAQRNRDLYEALKKSMVKRRQPLLIIITHAGHNDEGICYEEYDYAKRVLSGTIPDETCLPVIFEASPVDDWTDPALWRRVNPGHGITVKADAIATECLEAQSEPRKRNDFLRFHLNRWTSSATAWIPLDWWEACTSTLDDAELQTLPCAAGLDLAQKWDLACFSVVFRYPVADTACASADIVIDEAGALITKTIALNYGICIVPFFWIPENTMRQHEKEDGVPYTLWAERGLVTPTEGDVIDYTRIYRDITTKIVPRFPKLKSSLIAYDPAFATDLATKLRDLAGLPVVEILQNYQHLSEPSQIFEALLKGHRVRHDGHRILRQHVEQVAIKRDDAGRIRPVKPRNTRKRIDGVVATIMGVKGLSLAPERKVSVYATRGAFVARADEGVTSEA